MTTRIVTAPTKIGLLATPCMPLRFLTVPGDSRGVGRCPRSWPPSPHQLRRRSSPRGRPPRSAAGRLAVADPGCRTFGSCRATRFSGQLLVEQAVEAGARGSAAGAGVGALALAALTGGGG